MKANKLMIGDWVYAIDINGEKHPCRANNLEYDYTNKRGDFCVDFYGTGYEAEWPDVTFNVEPIPITPEILEKNGFKKQAFEGWEFDGYYENSGLVYQVLWRNDYSTPHLMINSFSREYGSYSSFNISSLHQLQHALRLCGIEKEIVL